MRGFWAHWACHESIIGWGFTALQYRLSALQKKAGGHALILHNKSLVLSWFFFRQMKYDVGYIYYFLPIFVSSDINAVRLIVSLDEELWQCTDM